MTAWTRGSCETDGVRIDYLRTGGAKPSIVLLHGLTGNGATWTPVARALEREFDVVMPDARGHGASSTPARYRYHDHARDVVGLIAALELTRPVLIGHSMGGMTAAVVASRHGQLLRGLVLVDPTFLSPELQREVHQSDVADQHRRLLERPTAELVAEIRARHPRRSAEIVELLVEARRSTRIDAFEVLVPPNPDYRELVRAIDVPTLLVIGDSPVVTLDIAAELQLRVEQIAGAGHGVPYDQPERLAEVVASFVRDVG